MGLTTMLVAHARSVSARAALGSVEARAQHSIASALRLPLWSIHLVPRRIETATARLERSLAATEGWTTIGYEVNAPSRSCFLQVLGRAEFDRAEVVFANGDLRTLDLRGARRGNGVYELTSWTEAHDVLGVRMRARARSNTARIRLILGA